MTVYGFGERKTPRPFITACEKFVYFDVLNASSVEPEARPDARPVAAAKAKATPVKETATPRLDAAALKMLENAVTASADEDGRANLARVGAHLAKQSSDFDARNFGFARLTDLVEASGIVDVERSGDSPKIVTVRLKGMTWPKANR